MHNKQLIGKKVSKADCYLYFHCLPLPQMAGEVRFVIEQVLSEYYLSKLEIGDLQLIFSELFANCLKYGTGKPIFTELIISNNFQRCRLTVQQVGCRYSQATLRRNLRDAAQRGAANNGCVAKVRVDQMNVGSSLGAGLHIIETILKERDPRNRGQRIIHCRKGNIRWVSYPLRTKNSNGTS